MRSGTHKSRPQGLTRQPCSGPTCSLQCALSAFYTLLDTADVRSLSHQLGYFRSSRSSKGCVVRGCCWSFNCGSSEVTHIAGYSDSVDETYTSSLLSFLRTQEEIYVQKYTNFVGPTYPRSRKICRSVPAGRRCYARENKWTSVSKWTILPRNRKIRPSYPSELGGRVGADSRRVHVELPQSSPTYPNLSMSSFRAQCALLSSSHSSP